MLCANNFFCQASAVATHSVEKPKYRVPRRVLVSLTFIGILILMLHTLSCRGLFALYSANRNKVNLQS